MADKRLIRTFVEQIRRHPDAPRLVSEGDSWFSYPFHRNAIDHLDAALSRTGRFSLLRLERNRDELLEILSGKQKLRLRKTLARYRIDALLVSGGGNDLLGPDLRALLKTRTGSRGGPALIHKGRLERRIRQMRDAYRDLLALRDDHSPDCRVYAHGYDYPPPSGRPTRQFGFVLAGPWIRPTFEDHAITDLGEQQDLLRLLVDAFNDMLAGLAASRRLFVHVDLRGTLAPDQWKDEVHPSRAGFGLVADRFHAALARDFPELS